MSVFREGSTALITGGASGIGFAVAQLCLKHGMRVAVVDRNEEALTLAKKELNSPDVEVYGVDVSKEEDWKDLKEKVEQRFGGVEFLMLNAGVGGRGTWGDGQYFSKILDTNLSGVIHGLNTFVPSFQSRTPDSKPSAIVITGSKQGITNPPGNPAYNASKAAIKSLAEHLSFDLRESGTGVHLLVPGWTWTGMTGRSSSSSTDKKPAGAWLPSQVAEYLYQKMQEGQFYVLCPDNDVTTVMDKKRILWNAGDLVNGRPALSRWREEFKGEVEAWMKDCDVPE